MKFKLFTTGKSFVSKIEDTTANKQKGLKIIFKLSLPMQQRFNICFIVVFFHLPKSELSWVKTLFSVLSQPSKILQQNRASRASPL